MGFDFVAVFALSGAMGISPAAVAEWLPRIEAVAVSAMNRHLKDMHHG